MGFWDLVLICILTAASVNALSGKMPYKIAPLATEEFGKDSVIPELAESWNLKIDLGRRLLEGKAIFKEINTDKSAEPEGIELEKRKEGRVGVKKKETKTDKSAKQEGSKLEQKKEANKKENKEEQRSSDVKRKENKENSLQLKTSEFDPTKRDSKSEIAKNSRHANKQERADSEKKAGKKSIDPETEKSGNLNRKEREMKDSNQNTETKSKKAVGDGRKETTSQEKEERMHQTKVQKAAKKDSAEKGDSIIEGSETKIAKKQDQKRRLEAEKGTLNNKSAQKNSNKKKQDQKLSKEEVKKIANESSKVPLSDGKPTTEQSKGQGIKMKQGKEEVKKKAVGERSASTLSVKQHKEKDEVKKKAVIERSGSTLSVKQHKEKENGKDIETKDVELQVEKVSDSVDLDISAVRGSFSRVSEEPIDDDYGDLVQEFTDLPSKFQDTAEKVAERLTPDLMKLSDTSKLYFNMANQHIAESFSPIIGREYAPFLASVISYALLFLPLIVVGVLLEHIRALLSLQKVLLFIHIYLAAYFATLILASFMIGSEPMGFFYKNSLPSYIYLQLLQALGYLIYLILQTFNVIFSCSSDTIAATLTSVLQWVVGILVGLHYYVTVFHRAMATKAPRTSWKIYSIYCVSFVILCLSARIRRLKKHYVHTGDGITDKKN